MAVITLSREHQNGCVEIGQAVAERLEYDFIDRHATNAVLRTYGERWAQMAEELHEHPPTIWEKYDRVYMAFIALVESINLNFAAGNRAVILGRGTAFLLNDIAHVLKVRLYAPLEVRIERRMQLKGEDQATAEATIARSDKSRTNYIKALYGKKWTEEANYDLVYNTAIQTYDQVTQNLVEIALQRDRNVTAEGLQLLKDRALAAKVKAHISIHPNLYIPTLRVFTEGPEIVIQGVVHSVKQLQLIRTIVQQTIESHPVRDELKIGFVSARETSRISPDTSGSSA